MGFRCHALGKKKQLANNRLKPSFFIGIIHQPNQV